MASNSSPSDTGLKGQVCNSSETGCSAFTSQQWFLVFFFKKDLYCWKYYVAPFSPQFYFVQLEERLRP